MRNVGNYSSTIRLEVRRSEIDTLDKPSQRCDPSIVEPSVSKCVEEQYVERYLNCSLKRLMSNPMLHICNLTIMDSTEDMFQRMNRLDEREIFELTGNG